MYESFLGFARRLIVLTVGIRLDARLNLHVFNRLLRLPLDYFERHPAGETMHRISQVYKVRDFLTGKLLTTFLDLITLLVLIPFLFYLNSALAWIVLACSGLITLIILAYLKPLRSVFARVVTAETEKASALGETIFGVKTVKALALEPQRQRAMGRADRRGKQVAPRLRQAEQLAADARDPDRAFHVDRRGAARRLHGAPGPDRLRGRRAVRLHDAQHAGGAAARRVSPS